MRIVPFEERHLLALDIQSAQRYFGAEIAKHGYGTMLKQSGQAFTAIAADQVICCSGCVEIWENRAMAWALISKDAGRHMYGIHKAVSGFLAQAKWRRIEASVDAGFHEAERWMTLLGFENETPGAPMKSYRPDGGDCFLFARVKK